VKKRFAVKRGRRIAELRKPLPCWERQTNQQAWEKREVKDRGGHQIYILLEEVTRTVGDSHKLEEERKREISSSERGLLGRCCVARGLGNTPRENSGKRQIRTQGGLDASRPTEASAGANQF